MPTNPPSPTVKNFDRFRATLTTKFEWLPHDYPSEKYNPIIDALVQTLTELHTAYSGPTTINVKMQAHVKLHDQIFKFRCSYIEHFVSTHDLQELKGYLHTVIINSFPNEIIPQQSSAHIKLQELLQNKLNGYIEFILTCVKLPTFRLTQIFTELSLRILIDVIKNVDVPCNYDIYSSFETNLKIGLEQIIEQINVETKIENIEELIVKNLPANYNFDKPNEHPEIMLNDPCSFLEYIYKTLNNTAMQRFAPNLIATHLQALMQQANIHHTKLSTTTPDISSEVALALIAKNHRTSQAKNYALKKWAETQTGALIRNDLTQLGYAWAIPFVLQYRGGLIQIKLCETITECADSQFRPYFVLPEFLREAPKPQSSSAAPRP